MLKTQLSDDRKNGCDYCKKINGSETIIMMNSTHADVVVFPFDYICVHTLCLLNLIKNGKRRKDNDGNRARNYQKGVAAKMESNIDDKV